jgi:hypothetical protein
VNGLPANQISLENGDTLGEDSHEVARIWITSGAGSSVWIDAGILEDPHVFGFLIADTVRHAARAYATTYGMDEHHALQEIVDGLGEELREQFNDITTVQEGSLN